MSNLIFMIIGTVIVFLVILLLFPSGSKNDISGRLASLDDTEGTPIASATESELNKPFVDRVIRPLIAKLAGKSDDAKDPKAKKKSKSGLKKMLAQAGFPGGLTVAEFSVIQNLFKGFCPLIGLALGFVIKPNLALMGMVVGLIIGIMAPKMYLQKKIAQRQHDIQRGLPDVLDLLTVAVEAGLGFDAACDKVVKQMRMGEARRDAFKSMSERVDNPDFNAFVSAIIQADQLGVSIGQVLRIQSEQLREKRKQRAEEESAKAPVKMMIPLIFFIFPNVMLVIGAPAAFQMIEGLSGMPK